jgi:hypothetical protein
LPPSWGYFFAWRNEEFSDRGKSGYLLCQLESLGRIKLLPIKSLHQAG